MIKKLIQLGLAVVMLAGAGSAAPAFAASPNAVRGFVYEWFGLFDRNAPTADFLARLAPTNLEVDFPEQRLTSHADFTTWYQGILATYSHATHDLKDLAVTQQGNAWSVDLTVDWHAAKFAGGADAGLFHQHWLVSEAADGSLLIQKNRITAIPTAGSLDLYRPVTSLAEVPAGDDYGLKQPAVESPILFAGKHVALLAAPGVEDVELTFPLDYFTARGATVDVVAPSWTNGRVLGVDYTKPTIWVNTTKTLQQARQQTYDLVVVTGGPWNSGVLRNDADALALIKQQFAAGRWLAPLCSGTQVLIDTGLARNADVTGAPNVKIDLENAGAIYHDQQVVHSANLITGQDPRALPAFVDALKHALLDAPQ